jgi:hypothetical protein
MSQARLDEWGTTIKSLMHTTNVDWLYVADETGMCILEMAACESQRECSVLAIRDSDL